MLQECMNLLLLLFLHQLIYSCRLQEFDDQVALINDIIHVVEITIILDEHIERLIKSSVKNLIESLILSHKECILLS